MNDHHVESIASGERSSRPGPRGRPDGPNLAVLAIVHGALTVLGLVLGAVLAGGHPFPSPLGADSGIVDYLRDHGTAVQVAAMLQFGSAVPLAIFAATAYARQLRLGVRVPGAVISLTGGIVAAGFLALSALVMWVERIPEVAAEPVVARALALISFVTGGVGFATGAGLLIAGLAVPALILRFVPRWLAVAGVVIAACGEISFLSMVATPVTVVLPIVRFAGIAWLIVMGLLLPRRRTEVRRS